MDNNERPVCADGHTRTATDVLCMLTDTHGRPVCADGHPRTSRVHGRPVCASGHPQTSHSPRGIKSPKQSTGRATVLSPRTNVLIYVLRDSHGRPVCADRHRWTHTDSHGRPVCVGGHPRTQPTRAKTTRTVDRKGQRAESKDQRADMSTDVLCMLTDTHGRPVHTRTHTAVLCVLTNSHKQPRTSCVCWRTPTDVPTNVLICVLRDSHVTP
ncbi:unnamed protein product, partial [Brassica rapa]